MLIHIFTTLDLHRQLNTFNLVLMMSDIWIIGLYQNISRILLSIVINQQWWFLPSAYGTTQTSHFGDHYDNKTETNYSIRSLNLSSALCATIIIFHGRHSDIHVCMCLFSLWWLWILLLRIQREYYIYVPTYVHTYIRNYVGYGTDHWSKSQNFNTNPRSKNSFCKLN